MTLWAFAALNAIALVVLARRITATHDHLVEHLDRLTNHIQGAIDVSTQDAVNAITEQLTKARVELVNRINDVQAQLDAAGVAEQIDLTSLTAAAQALDDVVPDAPVENLGG